MALNLKNSQTVTAAVSPVDVNGNPSPATISNVEVTSSNPLLATVAPDPANANGVIVTAVAAGTVTLAATATATETDGTTNTIAGVADITITPALVGAAVGLVFTFGTPTP